MLSVTLPRIRKIAKQFSNQCTGNQLEAGRINLAEQHHPAPSLHIIDRNFHKKLCLTKFFFEYFKCQYFVPSGSIYLICNYGGYWTFYSIKYAQTTSENDPFNLWDITMPSLSFYALRIQWKQIIDYELVNCFKLINFVIFPMNRSF